MIFGGTRFAETTVFDDAIFHEFVGFNDAVFADKAIFTETKLLAEARFRLTHFNGDALFGGSEFGRHANFDSTLFGAGVRFHDVTFTGIATCLGAYARLDVRTTPVSGHQAGCSPHRRARTRDVFAKCQAAGAGCMTGDEPNLTSTVQRGGHDAIDVKWLNKRPHRHEHAFGGHSISGR